MTIAQQFVSIKPKSLSFEDAAGVPLVGLTAQGIIEKAKVQSLLIMSFY